MEKKNKQLLVEGNDDKHVILALCRKFNLPELFDVESCDGIDNIFESIPVRFKSGIETIGIIIDADTDINERWKTVQKLLSNQRFNIPNDLPAEGLVLSNGEVKVGVWVMPNNNINGMLEDFMLFLVPKGDELLPVVDDTLNEIENRNLNRYLPIHKSKARIHSWLSWQEDPGTPLGFSITKRYLTTDNENCEQLINWMKKLFVE